MAFYYVRPDESYIGSTVTGTVEATYDADWLTDGRPGFPVRHATALNVTATPPTTREVGLIAVCNHNIAGTVDVEGNTIPAATLGGDGIYYNSFLALVTPSSPTNLTLQVTQTPAIVGELYAGKRRELERQLLTEPTFDYGDPVDWDGEYPSIAPYDDGLSLPRRLIGEAYASDLSLPDLIAWHESTRKGTRPTLIVPRSGVNDAWLVTFSFRWRPVMDFDAAFLQAHPGVRAVYKVSFDFLELPRSRF